MKGIEVLEAYHTSNDWLPMFSDIEWTELPNRTRDDGVDIGWYAGMLEEKRPFYAVCWAIDQVTMLTVIVSNKGIENKTAKEMDAWLQKIDYYKGREKHMTPEMVAFKDANGNEFFSINIFVGVDDSPAYIDGGWIFPFEKLFEYNKKRNATLKN